LPRQYQVDVLRKGKVLQDHQHRQRLQDGAQRQQQQALVDQARRLITPDEAKVLIMKRWNSVLHETINGYLQTHQRKLLQAIEVIWEKYTTPLHEILSERESESKLLDSLLKELGYE